MCSSNVDLNLDYVSHPPKMCMHFSLHCCFQRGDKKKAVKHL